MPFKYAVVLLVAVARAASAASVPKTFTAPAPAPTSESSFYVGMSNGTITNTPNVPGKVFDRFIQIWLENMDYSTAAANPVFQNLSAQGITLSSYYALTHPSEPNYMAAAGGSFFGLASDNLVNVPSNVSTVVDLLEQKGISWSAYEENMPTDGYTGYSFTNPDGYTYYMRKHNPLVLFDSIGLNATRAARIRNFNDFAVDVSNWLVIYRFLFLMHASYQGDNNSLSQWIFVTPNMLDDGHDTNVGYAGDWLNFWLVPLLQDPSFNSPKTLIMLSFDEYVNRLDTNFSLMTRLSRNGDDAINNQVYTVLLGNAIPSDSLGYNGRHVLHALLDVRMVLWSNRVQPHIIPYSISTVENNWDLDNLGRGDTNKTLANVFAFVADTTSYMNNNLTTTNLPLLNITGTIPGPLNPNYYTPWPAPNTSGTGGGSGPTI
ncbi:hypothetical protein BU15DRAFT_59597 [Melanogaster broomeanus]|nr:hypothetical protein BU15DRAFT_59597 [Melanogaster broomeanus]